MVSLDGFIATHDGGIEWHVIDDNFGANTTDLLTSVDTLVFGRTTYELMASYWPTPAGIADDPVVAGYTNALRKVVV
ncbi:MAG TPA: hypothetical protein VGQ62_01690 [Chloroflexota bacterium]|jgi:dihydrofolate reductase|nr:hypothetical protein [Chloroflexota bacterium]